MKTSHRLFMLTFAGMFMFFSCASSDTGIFSALVGATSQVAAASGLISQDMATSISKTGDALAKAVEEITPQQEYYIGRAVGANILGNYKAYNSIQMQKYLNQICFAITLNSPRPELYKGYYVMILDSDEINAFATSGGHIMVTRGLLKCAKSEDALAAVLAHEVSHIQLQHGVKAIKTSRATGALLATAQTTAVLAGAELSEVSAAFDESVNEIVSTMVNSGYSKTQEFEADKTALGLMQKAGYDPAAMLDMLTILEQNEKGQTGGFSKTHPSATDRIKNVRANLALLPSAEIKGKEARTNRYVSAFTK